MPSGEGGHAVGSNGGVRGGGGGSGTTGGNASAPGGGGGRGSDYPVSIPGFRGGRIPDGLQSTDLGGMAPYLQLAKMQGELDAMRLYLWCVAKQQGGRLLVTTAEVADCPTSPRLLMHKDGDGVHVTAAELGVIPSDHVSEACQLGRHGDCDGWRTPGRLVDRETCECPMHGSGDALCWGDIRRVEVRS